jgi:HD-like signal output (HDOD) protein/CheY-like chemotaxis protein
VRAPERRSRVMFVDDEPGQLAHLQHMLALARDSWQMDFVTSGEEALRILQHSAVDAVVADLKMPGMSGAELLSQVQTLSPGTARLVLSNPGEPESVLDVVRSAQQFLTKPADARTLTSAITRCLSVQQSLTAPGLRELIGGISALPTLPVVYDQLVTAVSLPNVSMDDIATIVASDVATSTELLKLVNSAFFGLGRQVYSVPDAVLLLGLDNVQALVLAGSLFKVDENLSRILDVEQLRAQSLRRAAMGRAIARRERWTSRARDITVLSCMLRDVGLLVLTEGRPQDAVRLRTAIEREPRTPTPDRLNELETSVFGCSVPQASAYLLATWGFAPAIVHTIAATPLTGMHRGITMFERALSFATGRASHPMGHLEPEFDEYMTLNRALAWNLAADDVFAKERGIPTA